jgi:uncharacterized protein (TIGR02117 family)
MRGRWIWGALLLATGCAGPVKGLYPPAPGTPTKTVYVMGHGWHTGVAVRRADIPDGVWREQADFPTAEWLEVGWGDEVFYQVDNPTVWQTCRAAFWPTPSTLHVVGYRELTESGAVLVPVELSAAGHARLCRFIENSYWRGRDGAAIRQVTGAGQFYAARRKFFLPRTCNTWTAQALRAAGCPVTPAYALTAGNVLWQARRVSEAGQRRSREDTALPTPPPRR